MYEQMPRYMTESAKDTREKTSAGRACEVLHALPAWGADAQPGYGRIPRKSATSKLCWGPGGGGAHLLDGVLVTGMLAIIAAPMPFSSSSDISAIVSAILERGKLPCETLSRNVIVPLEVGGLGALDGVVELGEALRVELVAPPLRVEQVLLLPRRLTARSGQRRAMVGDRGGGAEVAHELGRVEARAEGGGAGPAARHSTSVSERHVSRKEAAERRDPSRTPMKENIQSESGFRQAPTVLSANSSSRPELRTRLLRWPPRPPRVCSHRHRLRRRRGHLHSRVGRDSEMAAVVHDVGLSSIARFGADLNAQTYRLFEMDEATLQQLLKDDGSLTIKGGRDDDAALCTADKTYTLRLAESSNSFLLAPEREKKRPREEGADNAADNAEPPPPDVLEIQASRRRTSS